LIDSRITNLFSLQVDKGNVVEIFLIDEGRDYDISHPMHLHGHSFYVVAMERHGKNNSNVAIASGTEGKNHSHRRWISIVS